MTSQNLKQKAVSGMIWSALQRYSTLVIQFISGIILARLLTPYDYGCIGMLLIFMVLAEAFIDGGFGSALIQKKNPTQEDYSTIFFWNLGMAVLLYLVLYFSAPVIAQFYRIPLLCDVLRVQGLILFIYAFNIVQRNQLQKKLNFKVLSIVTITTSIISLVVTITMAYHGFGVWALVTQFFLMAFIPALVFWFYVKWRPQLTFSWQSFKGLFSFGFYMFLTTVLNHFNQHIQGLLIGRVYNPSTLGYYTKAFSTENLASTSISQVLTQVIYPLYSEMQDDKDRLRNVIKNVSGAISYVSFPLLFILILCAKPIFVLLYSNKWLGSVPYFQILCMAGFAVCLQAINLQAVAAIGQGKPMFVGAVIKRMVGISAMVGGLLLGGMKGLLIGVVFNSWFSYLYDIYLVQKYIGLRCIEQLKDVFSILFFSFLVALVCFAFVNQFKINIFIDGIIRALLYVVLYIIGSYIIKPMGFVYCKSLIILFLRKTYVRSRDAYICRFKVQK